MKQLKTMLLIVAIAFAVPTFANVDRPLPVKFKTEVSKPNISWYVFVETYGACAGTPGSPTGEMGGCRVNLCYQVTLTSGGQIFYQQSTGCPIGTTPVSRFVKNTSSAVEMQPVIRQSACDYFATFPEGSRPDCTTIYF